MEIHQLRYFVAVADEGSFSRAAAKVRVAQPSLSQQIRKLKPKSANHCLIVCQDRSSSQRRADVSSTTRGKFWPPSAMLADASMNSKMRSPESLLSAQFPPSLRMCSRNWS